MIAVFDWGDGTTSSTEGWTSGTAYVVRYHAWATAGTYYVKVKARDYTGLESGWSGTLAVTVGGGTTSTSTTTSAPTVDLKADGIDGTLTRVAPAYYTLTWTTTGSPTTCIPGGTWSTSGDKTASGGTWPFNAVTVLGLKTYSLTCSNAYGSNTDTVYVDVVSSSTTNTSTVPAAPSSLRQTGSTSGYIALAWYDNSSNEDKFNLERKLSNGTTWSLVTQTGPNIVAYADATVTYGTYYDYRVQACLSGYGCSAYAYVYGVSNYSSGTSTSTTATTCPSNISSLLGSGCHDMYTGAYFNTNMDQYVLYGGSAVNYCSTAWVSGCTTGSSSTSTTSTSCPSNVSSLLGGSGCHWMTNGYFNGEMTQYVYSGGSSVYSCTTTWISGCTTGIGYSTSTVSTTCPSNISTLLGSGCHDMYTGAYFNSEMTQYVAYGGSTVGYCSTAWVSGCSSTTSLGCGSYTTQSTCAVLSGCAWDTSSNYCYYSSGSTSTTTYTCPAGQYWYWPPSGGAGYCTSSTGTATSTASGQREQLWNSFGLRSWVRTDADPARVEALKTACANVPSNSSVYIWTPNAGNYSSVDFGMPDPEKCRQATNVGQTCPAGQYWYVPPSGGAGYCTYTSSQAPTVDIKVDGSDTNVYRSAPASYSLSWNTTGNPTSCVPSGTWGVSGGSKSIPSGNQSFALVTVTGPKTYTLTCSNAYGSATDTVIVEVTAATVISTSTPPIGLQGGFVQGSVTDGSGKALVGVYVHVFTENFGLNFGSITGANGSFGLNIPAGTYLIEVSPPSVRTDLVRRAPQKFIVGNGEVRTLSLQFDAPSKTISGSVTFSSGEAIIDAEVGAYSSETNQWTKAFTDGSGKFSLRVSGGTWQVGIRPRDPLSAKWTWTGESQQVIFGSASGEEIRTVNFVIFVSDAKLTVHAVDQSGNVVQGAGIVVDSIGAGQKPIGADLPPPIFRKADGSGSADFLLKGGTYYVRAFLPSEFGYFNPDEQQVILAARQTKDVTLIFRRYETVTDRISLKGITKLDDGTLTAVFVWAWSESGDTAQMRSGENGVFNFQATPGRWHLGAGKEVGGFPYKSGELTVDVGTTTPSVEIVLAKVGSVKLPPPVEVTQLATQQIVAQATDGAKVTVPEGAAQSSGNVNVEMKPTIEAPSQAAAKVVSTVYDVNITNETGKEFTTLQKEIEITIPYNDEDLKKQGATEDTFVPSYYDETTGTWVKVDNYTIDKEKNVVIVRVSHLTRFALVAAADITPPNTPANVSVKTGQPGEVVIAWTKPASDFSHVKVYRSAVAGELGKIVTNNVTLSSTSDTDTMGGTKYYYTVRSVDPAGNESVNTTQVSVTASGVFAGVKAGGGALARKLSQGVSGDDVIVLQGLLIKEGFLTGSATGYFGALTKAAVVKFQEKYANEILTPNGLTAGTGSVGPATMAKVNQLLGGAAAPALIQNSAPAMPPGQATKAAILKTLQVGSSGDDVKALQELLLKEGVYPDGLVTGYFGNLTKQAVIRLQEKYASEILTPNGLTAGTGTVGPSTRAKLNQLLK
ncbi:MAG: hypothetical protein A2945_03515 [Candidatus Liptonbacteria bacterium RIFCSPLOWO2_01_FULL_52_25]|uniref:Fibronectin type-III domain-containing protein n=1 Tax=Candidatus Liptonbacteria bacterium RIFCSPLOWO2_01_FULL_52_25 TaxID=1798650 RepID=A0A1G2CJ04_9BACT|nr:MAG: hypothetical protein A2945_03515 [Candidatus Liptonbacteria bacterium RIFCSPLOWO2_01_FULL_52_25]